MIAHLRGTVAGVAPDGAVIEVGGVGMRVQCTPGTLATLRPGEPAQVATSLVVREDSLTLYGFASDDERNVFELLQTASGVGPRLALAMLAVHTPDALRRAVVDRGSRRADHGPRHRQEGRAADRAGDEDRLGPPGESGAATACPAAARSGLPRGGTRCSLAWSTWAGRPVTPTRPSRRSNEEGAIGGPERRAGGRGHGAAGRPAQAE